MSKFEEVAIAKIKADVELMKKHESLSSQLFYLRVEPTGNPSLDKKVVPNRAEFSTEKKNKKNKTSDIYERNGLYRRLTSPAEVARHFLPKATKASKPVVDERKAFTDEK